MVVGITGGIGSGKSTVCKIFEVLGAKVYYADDRAKKIMVENAGLVGDIKTLFGEQAYTNSQLNREWIAQQVFKDQALLNQLNQLVHPAVASDFESWKLKNAATSVLLKEAALLIETGSYKNLDQTILVSSPEKLKVARILLRDPQRSEEEVRKIMDKQLSDDEKRPFVQHEIHNDEEHSLIEQVLAVHATLVA